MKTFSQSHRKAALALLLLFPVPALFAASMTVEEQKLGEAHLDRSSDALALFLAGDAEGAARRLMEGRPEQPGTAAWHFEVAARLLGLSGAPRPENNVRRRSLGERARHHLAEAKRLTSPADQATLARIEQQTGFVNENFGGTRTEALRAYRAATELAPESKAAAAASQRLKSITRPEPSPAEKANDNRKAAQ